jgi:hypothetical protein
MKYKIKSFIVGVKEARQILCTTVYGQPARRAYDMGRKLSNGFYGPIEGVGKWRKGYQMEEPPGISAVW